MKTISVTKTINVTTALKETIRSLDHLSLDDAERAALRTNGFIACEQRRYCRVYKLRFRAHGRQRVRYLGTDAAAAQQLQDELVVWQASTRADRELRHAVQEALQAIRISNTLLELYVLSLGLKFHGRAIRRPRRKLAKPD
jgi:hypothetical protein